MRLTKTSIAEICQSVANKLKDYEFVISTSLKNENFVPDMQTYPWEALSLSHGYPGLICLFSEMDTFFPDQGWDQITHNSICQLVKEIEMQGLNQGNLFSGAAGIAFAIHLASRQGSRYQRLLSKLHDLLLEDIKINYLQPLRKRIEEKQFLSPASYDTISGINGILAYLLNHTDKETIRSTVEELLQILVALMTPNFIDRCQVPGWYAPCHLLHSSHQADFPNGCFDTGMAHGISGCLSILSRALLQGISVPGQKEAIQRTISWFQECQSQMEDIKKVWPARFSFDALAKNGLKMADDFHRDGWCYGTPGVAFSLFLASCALKDQILYNDMVEIMIATCRRFPDQSYLTCPSFCHGYAGLLTIISQLHLVTGIDIFDQTADRIANTILEHYDIQNPFGFKCSASASFEHPLWIDNVGLLDGSTGILLSLLFYEFKQSRPWLQIFTLA